MEGQPPSVGVNNSQNMALAQRAGHGFYSYEPTLHPGEPGVQDRELQAEMGIGRMDLEKMMRRDVPMYRANLARRHPEFAPEVLDDMTREYEADMRRLKGGYINREKKELAAQRNTFTASSSSPFLFPESWSRFVLDENPRSRLGRRSRGI